MLINVSKQLLSYFIVINKMTINMIKRHITTIQFTCCMLYALYVTSDSSEVTDDISLATFLLVISK